MLRILHLAKYYAPFRGGIETHVRGLALAQASMGHSVSVACVNHRNAEGQDVWSSRLAKTPSVNEHDDDVSVIRFGKFATFARFDFCRGIRKFLSQADKSYDIIHLHTPNPVMTLALALAKPKIPIVVTYHSDIVKQKFIRKPFSVIERAVFKRTSRFIVSSHNYLDSSETLQRYRDKCVVIPFGLELSPYLSPSASALAYRDSLKAKYGSTPLWLTVGRLVYYKGTEYAVRALVNTPGHLMIVGRGGDELAIQQLAVDLGVSNRITMVKDLSDDQLIGSYHAATAFWFPSIVRSEAFGLVQIEAMASGCPVINTAIAGSGVSWVSQDNISGWTVPIQDSNGLSEAANRLVNDPAVRERLSIGAVDRARKVFSIDRMVADTHALYQEVMSESAIRG